MAMISDRNDGGVNRRPRGVLALGWACLESALSGRTEHRSTAIDYPDTVVRRETFEAGGRLGWTISTLVTPRRSPAPWKIVVITGAPSWAEYWAPVMAALPQDREMVVVDRPGYGASEPSVCVPDLRMQAIALAPLIRVAKGQRLVLVGQSYGAAIALMMAAATGARVDRLILLSSYLGEQGPAGRRLIEAGTRFLGVIPRDLRHAVVEVTSQAAQIDLVHRALRGVRAPIHMIHGDADDLAPIAVARAFALQARSRRPISFQAADRAGHFLNDEPPDRLISALEACIPPSPPARNWSWPRLPSFAGPMTAAPG